MKFLKSLVCICSLLFPQAGWTQNNLISLQNGKLVYGKFANQGQLNAENLIPDFSRAGFKGGGIALPNIPVKVTLQAISGDNKSQIQQAIDQVEAMPLDPNGFRGAVLLKAGVYQVSSALFIRAGGVVLRGEGNGTNGTVLIATQKSQHNLINIHGSGSGYGEVPGSRKKITTGYVPTGTLTLEVEPTHSFKSGDNVVVQRTPNDAWVDALDMRQYGWLPKDYRNTYERQIVAVSGNQIKFDAPIVDVMEDAYGGGEVYKSNITGRIENSGIENMRLESDFLNNDDENHGWVAIELERAQNCWVKQVIAKYFGYAGVSLSNMSVYNTIEDCAMIDPKSETTGGRKYSFNLENGSSFNFFQRCMTWGGRHDYVTGSKVPGPNVFLDCISDNTFADIGPHHRWSTGLLFDNVYAGQIRVQNRGASGTGHGWAGVQTLFYNCFSYRDDIKVESPLGGRNWGIGDIGQKQNGNGYWESWGQHILPRSLYLQQLEERLGVAAVQQIATEAQRQGRLWPDLKTKTNQIAQEIKVAATVTSLRGELQNATPGIKIAPNPVINNNLILNLSEIPRKPGALKIYDLTGKLIMQRSIPSGHSKNFSLDISDLSVGEYLLRYELVGKAGYLKFIKTLK